MAKLSLYKEKEEDDSIQQIPASPKPKEPHFDCNFTKKYNISKDTNQPTNIAPSNLNIKLKPCSYSNIAAKRKFKEGNMRIKQSIKVAHDIIETMECLEKVSKRKSSTTFVTPLELQRNGKRWEEFSHLAGRSLFSLKREVNLLSLKISSPLNRLPNNSLRLLASASRSCLHLLKGLENFPNEIKVGHKGNVLLCEALVIAQQILLIMAMGGISLPQKNCSSNVINDENPLQSTEESITEFSEILSSEVDSDVLSLLKPKAVRKKLSHLAQSYVAKNKRQKIMKKPCKIISPLKGTEMAHNRCAAAVNSEETRSHPVIEELEEGRTIQFVHDSLSPKIRKRTLKQGYRKTCENDIRQDNSPFSVKENVIPPSDTSQGRYGISEKMADAVFERILPYVRDSRENVDRATTSKKPLKNYSDIEIYIEAQRRIEELQERFAKFETTTERQRQFLSEMNSKVSNRQKGESNSMDLNAVIERANISLRKCVESDYPYHYPAYSIDAAMASLRRTGIMEVRPVGMHTRDSEHISNQRGSDLPNVQDELRAQKLDFWRSLVDNNYVAPPNDNVCERQNEAAGGGDLTSIPVILSRENVENRNALRESKDSETNLNRRISTKEKETQVSRSLSYEDSFEDDGNRSSSSDREEEEPLPKCETGAEVDHEEVPILNSSGTDIEEEGRNGSQNASPPTSDRESYNDFVHTENSAIESKDF